MRGRKSKPEPLKVLQGTFRSDRANADAPQPVRVAGSAPSWLSRRGVEWFGILRAKVSPLGLDSDTFTESLGLLAAVISDVEELEAFIAENGRTYETTTPSGDRMRRPHPEVAMLSDARKKMQSLAAEFGLTPASIQKVSGVRREPEKKGFAAL